MSLERSFRGDDETAAFDWQRPARDLEITVDTARALYLRALRRADDLSRAEALYLRWLRDAAAARRPVTPLPAPGRRTQVMRDTAGSRLPQPELDRLGPGKWTRALLETGHDERLPGRDDVQRAIGALSASAATQRTGDADTLRDQLRAATSVQGAAEILAAADPATAAATVRELRGEGAPILRLVTRAANDGEVARVLGRGSAAAPLPGELAARLGPHVGAGAAGAARLHTDDAADLIAAAHHAHAVTLGDDIYFARGAYAPGTERGDDLLTHELTHVAQGQRGDLARAAAKGIDGGATLDPSEAEADLRARLAVIELHAPAGAAPPLAAPSGQPTSDGDRQAKIAAQQQRIATAGQTAAQLTVPPAPPATSPQAPVPHQPPKIAAAVAPALTGNAYVDTFQAPPSKQAMELWGKAGGDATRQASADQAKFDAALPPMPIVLDGSEAKGAKGGGAIGRTPGKPPAAGAAPPAAQPTPTPAAPRVTTASTAAQAIQPTADKAQLKADGQKVIGNLPTSSPDVKTDPGPAPVTDLAGQSDPVRTLGDQQHAVGEGAKALDEAKAKVIHGPGAAQVQPIKMDEKLKVPKEQAAGPMPALPTVDGMAKLKKWNLPGNVQSSFDDVAKPRMDASLAQGKAKMLEAEHKRDADRTKAVTGAEDKVKAAHADADKQQQAKVAQTRTQIANHQSDSLVKHEAEVKKLDQQAGDKKTGTVAKINTRISADQSKVDGDYKDAARKADDQKKQGEAEAAKKKKEAEDKQKDEHWWDKAADAVCDGIKAIADEIDHVLDQIGKAIGQLLDAVKNAACQLIDAARDFVCQALTEFGDWLKSAVTQLIGSVFPELAAALNRLIDQAVNLAKAAVNAVADGLKQAVTALCDGLKAAIDAAIAAFKAAVQAAATFAQALVTGDWSLVGKMILEGILKLLGIDPGAFYALIGKAMDSIDKIIENPGAFVGHLIDAVKLGFKQFGANFWAHLKDGLVQWLFGTFASAGITMPAKFDIAGIFDLVCQVLGITWPRMRGKVVKVIGEKNTERLEFVSKYLQALVTGGFAGLWEQIQHDMSGLWDMVIGGVKSWIIEKVVQQAIIKIATMWNPAGAIIQLIQTAWNVYQWVRENAQRIFGLVQAVVDSISNIVAGNIGGAANFIEASLAKLVPIAISLFANLLGLGGIADKIKGIIEKVQTKVDQAIDKLIDRVMKMFKGKGGKDDKDGDHKDGEDEAQVPKSLAEPHKTTLTNLGQPILHEAANTPTGTVLYTGGTTDPKEATKAILANHKDAKLDKASGTLHLPPVQSETAPTSLKTLAAEIGRSTGLPKITFVVAGKGWRLDGQINPTVDGLATYSGGAAAGRLEPLIHALAPHAAATKPRKDLETACRDLGKQFSATVHIASPLATGVSQVTFTEQAPPDGQKAETYQVQIVPEAVSDADLKARAGAGNTSEVGVSKRGGGSDTALTNTGPSSMAVNPAFEADAAAFEDKFGALAWGHGSASGGADAMAAKAKAYILAKVGTWDAANPQLAAMCADIGSDNPSWSGAAGKAAHDVMACFDAGNIAEKMNHVGEFFIKILGNDLINEREAEFKARLTQAGLDARALMTLKREIEAQKRAGGRPSPWAIAPTAPGSAANEQWHARADRVTAQGIPDDAAHQQERHDATHSDRTIGETGASLSPRELAVQQGGDPSWDQNTQKVKWEEGTKKWIMNERDMWVQWQRQLGLPLGAGPSGTTNQLMSAAKALRCDAYAARAACIAYLLPAHHHTLVEILAAAQPFGCTYTPGQKMYRKINPFGDDELRNCGKPGPDGKKLFPDEVSGDNNAAVQGPAKLVLPAAGGGGGAGH